ncbi:MAG: aminotransferase class V-fold PLP-dependent enzyme, partial [Deltaproteobacteria bacterium]|nr:aminotransferase class V-fold PLP-dependent enzyme [Deltaproteobacteria bacterium]
MTDLEVRDIREDFPQLRRLINGKPPIYLDNACTTLRPEPVIRAMADHQRTTASCHGRAYHFFGREATEAYAGARRTVQGFLGASSPEEVLFVRNATEGLNLVARSLPLTPDDVVLTTNMEHNSNLLPWQRLTRAGGARHRIIRMDVETGFDLDALRGELERGVRLVSLFHVSNFSGIEAPVKEVCTL